MRKLFFCFALLLGLGFSVQSLADSVADTKELTTLMSKV